MKANTTLLTLAFCFFSLIISTLQAQSSLSISVKDNEKTPLIGATVQLMRLSDSITVSEVTDPDGIAKFDRLSQGLYSVSIRYIGFQNLEKSLTVKPGQLRLEYALQPEALALGEVTVTAKRPLIRQEDDKMIIDPEPIANSSTSTLEVLEKTPGIFVDQEGGIFLNSATPAVIYINGREQRMSARDIATILQSLPPGSVQKIEVLRTPSTKYDAASSGGIINVVLKKGVRIGRTGSLNMGMNQGVYGNQFIGINLNDSGGKGAYYINTNYSRNDMVEDLESSRELSAESILSQNARSRFPADFGYVGYGFNLDPNDRWGFNYDGRVNLGLRRSSAYNVNTINSLDNILLSENDNSTDNRTGFFSLQQDLGLLHKIDTLGSEWDTKFSYNYNSNNNEQDYSILSLLPLSGTLAGNGDNRQNRHFFLLQSDLTYRFSKQGIKLETGFKSTWQHYDSRADYFFNVNGGASQPDALRTNAFSYRENINAAYLQASKSLPGNFLLKTGVRMENTRMNGRQTVPADTSFVINRTDWFPYVYLSRPIMKIASFSLQSYLIYRRTINRPGYQNLNPYIKIVDPYLYETGNPALQPQFTDNIEANISFNDMPIFAIGRNYTRDIFSNVVYQDPQFPEVAVRTFDNVGQNRETYFRIVGAIPPGGKYFFVVSAQYNLNDYNGLYENQPLSFSRGSWQLFTFHSFNLTPDTKLTMNAFVMFKGQQNFYELDTFGQLNFGITQTMWKKKLSITLSARDVLRTMVTRFNINQGSINVFGERYNDNQRFGMNLRYNFGMKKRDEQQNMFAPGDGE